MIMGKQVGLIYGEEYLKYDFSPSHPLQSIRLRMTIELMRAYGLLDQPLIRVIEPRRATDEELELIHSADYIERVKQASENSSLLFLEYGLGTGDNPVFSGMHEAASCSVGGSLKAAELIMEGEASHCFNIGGGLHHALKNRASGFCIYNDAAVTIAFLMKKYGCRVAYIDIDAHHGDGVQWAFYDTNQVLTISLHESGRYLFPGTGFVEETGKGEGEGFSVNIPLAPSTYDQVYLSAFREIVPPLIGAFKPDIIVSQNGCDAHFLDPLTHLALTVTAYQELAREIHELAHKAAQGRWIALGGGGYEIFRVVPRAWTVTLAEMAGISLPDEIPPAWLKLCQLYQGEALSRKLLGDEAVPLDEREKEEINRQVQETVCQVKERIFPVFGLER